MRMATQAHLSDNILVHFIFLFILVAGSLHTSSVLKLSLTFEYAYVYGAVVVLSNAPTDSRWS